MGGVGGRGLAGCRPTAYMIVATTAPYAALCNTNLVKGADIPQSWDDMTDPKWNNRTGHWMRASFLSTLFRPSAKINRATLVKRLAALRPRLFDGQFPLAEAVGSGEIALAITAYDFGRKDGGEIRSCETHRD